MNVDEIIMDINGTLARMDSLVRKAKARRQPEDSMKNETTTHGANILEALDEMATGSCMALWGKVVVKFDADSFAVTSLRHSFTRSQAARIIAGKMNTCPKCGTEHEKDVGRLCGKCVARWHLEVDQDQEDQHAIEKIGDALTGEKETP